MGLTMITGGARSGKSTFAEEQARQHAVNLNRSSEEGVLYIATALAFDEEMCERIRRHQRQRPAGWRTVEQFRGLKEVILRAPERVILLDCITVMLTNLLFADGLVDEPDRQLAEELERRIAGEVQELLDAVRTRTDCEVILVTNELGMGVVPAYPLGRIFRDIAGRANQRIAAASDRVYLVVSGIPVLIKGEGAV